MSDLRPDLLAVVRQLLTASETSGEVTLDQLGDAIGALAASYPEIDAMIAALEAEGRRVIAPAGGSGEAHLARVVNAAKELTRELGHRPNVVAIASRAGLSIDEVKQALVLARIMQR
ncbi:MAG TPA: sigma-70 domain-containing protein [Polyangiales bacterium]|nr:sigma-70 domain-containing protein [Polyangiales bacterium]